MIKANELRIGNWVRSLDTNDPFRINAYGILRIATTAPENIQPIPLTPEILEKAGWGKSDEHELGDNSQDFMFFYDYHFKVFRIETENDCHKMSHIQYLHQLQNLYFALTGEELAINL